jgi:hypothetical protein
MDAVSLQVPTVAALRSAFPIPPESYTLSREPTNTEIKKLRASVKANLKQTTCLLPNTENIAWSWLIMTPEEWIEAHTNETAERITKRHTAIATATNPEHLSADDWLLHHSDDADLRQLAREQWALLNPGITIDYEDPPPMPNPTNPGMFVIDDNMSVIKHTRAKERYMQHLYTYSFKSNLVKAVLKDLSIAIPKALVTDIQDDSGTFTKTSLLDLLQHINTAFHQIRPKDISTIMETFNTPYDLTLTLAEYFKRQQECQKDLKDTLEPISTATMIRTSYAHFLALAHMGQACDDWETANPDGKATTWTAFKQFFTKKFRQYNNRKNSLQDAGIANSATATTHDYTALQEELTRVQADNLARDTHLANIIQQNHQLAKQLENLSMLASSSGGSQAPPVRDLSFADSGSTAFNTNTSSELMLAFNELTKKMDRLTAATPNTPASSNSTVIPPTGTRVTYPPRSVRRFNNDNYCWTHGCDLHPNHTGPKCKNKKIGHKNEATVTNRMGGSTKNLHLVQ